jgi:hypothetical protein
MNEQTRIDVCIDLGPMATLLGPFEQKGQTMNEISVQLCEICMQLHPGEKCRCGTVVCADHTYRCDSCGEMICQACMEIYERGENTFYYCEQCYKTT